MPPERPRGLARTNRVGLDIWLAVAAGATCGCFTLFTI